MGAVLAAVAIGDSSRLGRRSSARQILLDRAYAGQTALVARLEGLLGGTVISVKVIRIDLVNDTTLVDVRVRPVRAPARGAIEQEMLS